MPEHLRTKPLALLDDPFFTSLLAPFKAWQKQDQQRGLTPSAATGAFVGHNSPGRSLHSRGAGKVDVAKSQELLHLNLGLQA